MKVKFKQGFSLNGKWYKKDDIEEFNEKIANSLIKRDVAKQEANEKQLASVKKRSKE